MTIFLNLTRLVTAKENQKEKQTSIWRVTLGLLRLVVVLGCPLVGETHKK